MVGKECVEEGVCGGMWRKGGTSRGGTSASLDPKAASDLFGCLVERYQWC